MKVTRVVTRPELSCQGTPMIVEFDDGSKAYSWEDIADSYPTVKLPNGTVIEEEWGEEYQIRNEVTGEWENSHVYERWTAMEVWYQEEYDWPKEVDEQGYQVDLDHKTEDMTDQELAEWKETTT